MACDLEKPKVPAVVWSRMSGYEHPEEPQLGRETWGISVEMLRAVLDGATYTAVAANHAVTRTAVERRIKAVAAYLVGTTGIDGLNEQGAAIVRRLRLHRTDLHAALEEFSLPESVTARSTRTLSDDEISAGAMRIRARSHEPLEDLALYYILFAIGARPLEIARLEVRDYIDMVGNVRVSSVLRKEVSITSRPRPMYFHSTRLNDALGAYLVERARKGEGIGADALYRGLNPRSRLFLSASGLGFEITPYGDEGQQRFRCRSIQEVYRKLFRYAELKGVTALTVRHTVAERLYARGADESQVGLLLGISELSSVRRQFPRRRYSLDELTRDLV